MPGDAPPIVHKVVGIETEYGIEVRGHDPRGGSLNPTDASSQLIRAYAAAVARRVGWDFGGEHPDADARGFSVTNGQPPEIETHLVNAVLTNGARFYVDHAHPEYSTPECENALQAVIADRAGERVLQLAMSEASRLLPPGVEIVVYKNNSDGKGNSYGCHENYLMGRGVPFSRIVDGVTAFMVSRQLFTGSGKVGTEAPGTTGVPFQLTQRADFFEEEVGLETTIKRPIVNTRDEPHADQTKYRRLHVISADANRSEIQTFLKVGSMSLVLAMIEADFLPLSDLELAEPVRAFRQVSYDLTLQQPLTMKNGRTMTAIELQWEYLTQAQKFAEHFGLACVDETVGPEILDRWEDTLTKLETDFMSLNRTLDWVAKYELVSRHRERKGVEWTDPSLKQIDLRFADVRLEVPTRSGALARNVYETLDMARLRPAEEMDRLIRLGVTEPPTGTRAYFRGKCLSRWAQHVVAANWDSIVFDLGTDPLRRVPMMEPLRGSQATVGTLLDEVSSPAELLQRLGQA